MDVGIGRRCYTRVRNGGGARDAYIRELGSAHAVEVLGLGSRLCVVDSGLERSADCERQCLVASSAAQQMARTWYASVVASAAHEVAAGTASVKVTSNGMAEAMRRKLRSPCRRRCWLSRCC